MAKMTLVTVQEFMDVPSGKEFATVECDHCSDVRFIADAIRNGILRMIPEAAAEVRREDAKEEASKQAAFDPAGTA